MTEPCDYCDFIGPDQIPMNGAFRELHRAWHDLARVLVKVFEPFAKAALEQKEREQRVTRDAYVLISENVATSLRGENGDSK